MNVAVDSRVCITCEVKTINGMLIAEYYISYFNVRYLVPLHYDINKNILKLATEKSSYLK